MVSMTSALLDVAGLIHPEKLLNDLLTEEAELRYAYNEENFWKPFFDLIDFYNKSRRYNALNPLTNYNVLMHDLSARFSNL